jgi:phosphoglucosamine mutase
MRKLFGTDGIRGKANQYPMDALTAYRVGAAVGHYFRDNSGERKPRVLIGRDTRVSGTMLESAIAAGLCAVGSEAMLVGVVSTPAVAYLTHTNGTDAGIVISASHNPFVDNGIKIFANDGFKLPDSKEEEIEQLILEGNIEDLYVAPHEVGSARPMGDIAETYKRALIASMDGRRLDGMRIVIDCANGAAFRLAPELFSALGATLVSIGVNPDGLNINKACGSTHIANLQEAVRAHKAQMGVAFDGDADRAIFVDGNGDEVDGDHIMAICAVELKKAQKLPHDTLVATVMSNLGLTKAMSAHGINVRRTDVGDRYVVEEMRNGGFGFGGEQSGHLIFMEHATSGDGLLTALQILKIMVDTGKNLSDLASVMTSYPQVLKNLIVTYKRPIEELASVVSTIQHVEEKLADNGRVLVRFSGTENKARVMIEGDDRTAINQYADEIIHALDAELN